MTVTMTVKQNKHQPASNSVKFVNCFFVYLFSHVYVKAHQHEPAEALVFWVIPLLPSVSNKQQMQLQTVANMKL